MTGTALILVTHLLGVGHLTRAAALGRGLAESGYRVVLVSGGRPAPLVDMTEIELIQLPSVHCVGVDFRTLLGADGEPVDAGVLARRRSMILDALGASDPDIVVTETWPFGRRQLRAEFAALVEAARNRGKPVAILSSIRDILNPPAKPARAAETEAALARWFDGVLVHGDAAITPLSASWPTSPALERHLVYTGYICDAARSSAGSDGNGRDIVVSGGGSAASLPLFRAALGAAASVAMPWRVLVGHGVAPSDFAALLDAAPANVVVERARPDFPSLLAGAALSISQAGYNTVIDLVQAKARAILVPFEQGKEAEQRLRAERFAALGLATVIGEAELTPERLAVAVQAALGMPRPSMSVDLDGLAGAARGIGRLLDERRDIEAAWGGLDRAIAGQSGRVTFWWRDDDAIAATPELDRLLALAERHDVPVSLAVIPADVRPDLATRLAGRDDVTVLTHGYSHRNHAPEGERKRELGFRPPDVVVEEVQRGRARLDAMFGAQAWPVLVPPWNRIDGALLPRLAEAGFTGLSTHGRRTAMRRSGLAIANTHCDPIDWRGHRGLISEARLLRELADIVTASEPIGILTHHLVHDEWIWAFLGRLFGRMRKHDNVVFAGGRDIFGTP